jgi:aspartate oxidase
MNNQRREKKQTEISIIGSGIAGITTAFHLGKKGYKVNLIDPTVKSEINNLSPKNGTQARLVDGRIEMDKQYALEKGEEEDGYILTCQAHPVSETVLIDFD